MTQHFHLTTQRQPVVLDLFCGAGGLSLGFEMAGYTIGLGIEKDLLAYQTHCHNFGGHTYLGSIEEIEDPVAFTQRYGLNQVDVIIGGPPCQGYSRVGRGKMRKLNNNRDYIDARNRYYLEFLRFVIALRPLYFVIENVPDMKFYEDYLDEEDGEDGQKRMATIPQIIRQRVASHGYYVEWDILEAHHYGVPQTRKRFFIIGTRVKSQPICWPEKKYEHEPVTVWQAISDLPIVDHNARDDEIPYRPRFIPLNEYQRLMREGAGDVLYNHQTRWHNPQDLEAFTLLPEGGKYIDLPESYRRYRADIFKDKYRKLYRDRPSWTLEAHIGKDTYRHIYPSQVGEPEPPRTISVREAARLQSFPDRFRFIGAFTRQFMQVGNAVPPLLAKAIAEAIKHGVQQGMYEEEQARLLSYPKVPSIRWITRGA